jgi:2-polyprenyl-3-methyl-5-hydroxy-6-metoxy-1,4-benzoquinol methylase
MKANKILSTNQLAQEEQYGFPYHYLSVAVPLYRDVLHFQYVRKLAFIKKLLGDLHGKRILDFGCGDGRFCYELSDAKCEIVGVDYSHSALLFAKAFNPSVSFFNALEDVDGKFDWVMMIDVLEHIPPNEINNLLELVSKSLAPDAKLLVSVPSVGIPVSRKHYQHFTADSISKLLSEFFHVSYITGHMEGGGNWRKYSRTVAWAALWYSFSTRFSFLSYWLKRLRKTMELMEPTPPENCHTIVAVFTKKLPSSVAISGGMRDDGVS